MFSQPLANFKNETKTKTYLRASWPPGASGALRSLRILRIRRIGSGSDSFPEFRKNILICVPKMNEGLTSLERHEGE